MKNIILTSVGLFPLLGTIVAWLSLRLEITPNSPFMITFSCTSAWFLLLATTLHFNPNKNSDFPTCFMVACAIVTCFESATYGLIGESIYLTSGAVIFEIFKIVIFLSHAKSMSYNIFAFNGYYIVQMALFSVTFNALLEFTAIAANILLATGFSVSLPE